MRLFVGIVFAALAIQPAAAEVTPVTTSPWTEAIVSVTDLDRSARFFREIGGYEVRWQGSLSGGELEFLGLASTASGEALLLGRPGARLGPGSPRSFRHCR